MNEIIKSASLAKLNVGGTLEKTFQISWRYRKVLALWVVGCTLLSGGFCLLFENLFTPSYLGFSNKDFSWLKMPLHFLGALVSALVSLMVCARFSVFCHRLVLTGQEDALVSRFSFSKREWRFLRWNLFFIGAIFVIGFLVIIGNTIVLKFLETYYGFQGNGVLSKAFIDQYLFWGFFYGMGSYALAQYCLVFPATALGHRPSLAWSRKRAKGNECALALLFGGLPFIFGFLYCPPSLLTLLQVDQFMIVRHVIRPFLIYLVTPIEVIAISLAFRELTNGAPSTTQFEDFPIS